MICPNCGASNEQQARFCDRCGSQLPAQARPTTGPTVSLAPDDAAPRPAPAPYTQPSSGYDRGAYSTAVPQQSGMAVFALILAIVSFFGPYVLTAIPAVLLGYSARREIEASGGRLSGAAVAQWAIILGWVSIALSLLGFCVFCLFFAAPFGVFLDI